MEQSNHYENNEINKTNILFICLGNICRSPAAEGIMKALVKQKNIDNDFFIDSAAIGNWHIGQLPDIRMRRHGSMHGYNFDSHARQFSKRDFDRFDHILVMDNDNYRTISAMAVDDSQREKVTMLADFMTHHPQYNIVPDPYYGDDNDFEIVIDLLEDACQGLLDSIISTRR